MNTEDRELLRLAAKAAGWELRPHSNGWFLCGQGREFLWLAWNPLIDDGNALRLAAALKFTVDFESGAVWGAGDLDETCLGHTTADEPCMRRAIVRAAAEIGRRMA